MEIMKRECITIPLLVSLLCYNDYVSKERDHENGMHRNQSVAEFTSRFAVITTQRRREIMKRECKTTILLVLLLGSRGPSTVTLMAFWYSAIWGGLVNTAIDSVKLLPATEQPCSLSIYRIYQQQSVYQSRIYHGQPVYQFIVPIMSNHCIRLFSVRSNPRINLSCLSSMLSIMSAQPSNNMS